MHIRNYQPGDEAIQAMIYNQTAGGLPKFKPATEIEIRRRTGARDFDPTSRFVAEVAGQPVAYANFHANGRVSYPWCLQGHEATAVALFEKLLQTMKERGLTLAFAAYRTDWQAQNQFFADQGFRLTREMVSYVLDEVEMPTRTGKVSNPVTPLQPDDIPDLIALAPQSLRVKSPAALEKHLLRNPYFSPESVFAMRSRSDNTPLAVGICVTDPTYADPNQVDANMPCFRLGAVGTEGMQVKKINGLFSFCAGAAHANQFGLNLMQYAAEKLEVADVHTLAAQVPTDVPHLARFYQSYFRRQGSFPVYELSLSGVSSGQ